jgi:hypothetical protein
MKVKERKTIELNRRYARRLYRIKRMQKHNGYMRESLYAKMDRQHARLRTGLKDYIVATYQMRRTPIRISVPDCPKQRWV